MAALNLNYLLELYQYMSGGGMALDFSCSSEERRLEILEFLDKLMDLGEMADQVASEMIFRDSQLGLLAGGVPGQGKESQPGNAADEGDKAQR